MTQRHKFESWRRKTEFKPVKLHLKINLVSYPAWAEGLVNRIADEGSYAFLSLSLSLYIYKRERERERERENNNK